MAGLIEFISQEAYGENERFIKQLDKMVEQIRLFKKEARTASLPSDTAKRFKETTTEINKSNKAVNDSVKFAKKFEQAQVNQFNAMTKRNQALQKRRFETQQLTKASKEEAVLTSRLSTEYQKLVVRMNQAGRAVQNLTAKKAQGKKLSDKEQSELRQSSLQFNKYQASVLKADAAIGRFNRNVGNYPKGVLAAANATRAFASALGLTSGVMIVADQMRQAIETIKEYNAGLLNVSKTTGLSGAGLEQLGADILNLSKKLQTVGTQSLLEYATVAGQLGVKGSKDILAFSEALAKLETASDISGEEGGAQIARLLTLVDGGVENVDLFGDEIVRLGNNFAATEGEILKNATAIAQNTGLYKLGRQQVLAYATATKAVGIESEITGSTVGKTLGLLEKALRTGEGVEAIAQLTGKSIEELKGQFKDDAGSVFTDLLTGLNKVSVEGGSVNEKLEELGIIAVRDQRVIGSLATAGFGTLEQAMLDVGDATGALNAEFETASTKLVNQVDRFSISWDNLILSIENGNGAIGKGIVQGFDNASETLDKWSLVLHGNTTVMDRWKIGINNATRTLSNVIPFVESGVGVYQEYTDALLDNNIATEELTKSIEAQYAAFIEAHGSIAPLTKEIQDLADAKRQADDVFQDGLFSSSSSNQGKTEEEIVKINDLKAEIKRLTNEVGELDSADVALIRTKQAVIKQLKKELDAILGVTKAGGESRKQREKEILVLKDYFEALKKANNEADRLLKLGQERARQELNKGVDTSGLDATIAKENELATIREAAGIQAEKEREFIKNAFIGLGDALGIQSDTISDLFDSIQFGFVDAGEAAEQFGALFSDVLGGMAAAENARIDAQIEGLGIQKEVALRFTGDSAAARERIEERYTEKVNALKTKQAENEKRNSVIQSIINTAVAVTKVFAELGFIAGLPAAGVVGALGAAQTAIIASQPIPQFAQGGITPGGVVMVNDAKGSNYREAIQTPDGNIFKPIGRDLLLDLPQGSRVFNADETTAFENDLNNVLYQSGINPFGAAITPTVSVSSNLSKGITKQDMKEAFSSVLSNRPTNVTKFDKNGFETYMQNGLSKTTVRNNRVTQKGFDV